VTDAMIIGTAGHVDHGKTALVKALTGVDTDRLKEEKARGISIDLGFAFRPVSPGVTLGFIDVPGHERFVHTMVAGVSGIDLALLVVAADDGVMPQTREHLAILELLGVERGLVAVTKADLVSQGQLQAVTDETAAVLRGTQLDAVRMTPVSVVTGLGIDTLLGQLVEAAAAPSARPVDARFRLAVDRAFTLPGIGVVVTGTVLSGAVRADDRLVVSPSGIEARVRSVHAQNRPVEVAHAGDRCALNLVGQGISKQALRRGDVVVEPELHAPTDRIDARLTLLRSEHHEVSAWHPVRLHHAATEVGAHIALLEHGPLAPGDAATVQLVLDRPIAAAARDHFVLRDISARRTIGGGRFIDLRPPARRRRTPLRVAQRAAQDRSDPAAAFGALLETAPYAWDLSVFARDRALSPGTVERIITALRPILLERGHARLAIGRERWRAFCASLIDAVTGFHRENPHQQGIAGEGLRTSLEPRLPARAFAVALEREELARQVVREAGFVRLVSHFVRPSPEDEAIWARIGPLIGGEHRFRPPRVRDLATLLDEPEERIRRVLRLVARLGRVDQVAHDHFFLRATVAEMATIVESVAARSASGVFTAAQVRDHLSNGRKVTIQILEFFDRLGLTRLQGEERRMRGDGVDLFE
jgi:selenocysteine-specific elongation factor